ncbi:Homeodomain-like protein, partial [Baffinella frigidus]
RKGVDPKPWTEEEDAILSEQVRVKLLGNKEWMQIAKPLPGRTGKQCRERYKNHVASGIKSGAWTPEEDGAIMQLQLRFGNRWSASQIAKFLPGRSDNAIKNRFNSATHRK